MLIKRQSYNLAIPYNASLLTYFSPVALFGPFLSMFRIKRFLTINSVGIASSVSSSCSRKAFCYIVLFTCVFASCLVLVCHGGVHFVCLHYICIVSSFLISTFLVRMMMYICIDEAQNS
jgi:hypothetical protein